MTARGRARGRGPGTRGGLTARAVALLALCALLGAPAAPARAQRAGALEAFMASRAAVPGAEDEVPVAQLPPGVRRIPDLAYGPAARQRFDAYLPERVPPGGAPLLVMVHGGAWMVGRKDAAAVVGNKVAHWVARGAILVSVDYRMVPGVTPLQQADDVAAALARVQRLAPAWGGDPDRLVLMGHSAGAHLVSLLSAAPAIAEHAGARPWRGTVALDSAALDLGRLMRGPHARFYDRVFGSDPALWAAASPTDMLAPAGPPMLLVCSTRRPDDACAQSEAFAARAAARGRSVRVSAQDLSHREVNAVLGLPDAASTAVVDAFLASLGWDGRPAGAPPRP